MAGYAVVFLVNQGTLAFEIAHRGQMRSFGAFRVDVSGVKNEGNTQRAENGSIFDGGYSLYTRLQRRPQCTETAPKQGINIAENSCFIGLFFQYLLD